MHSIPGQVISPYMARRYIIELDENDLGQLLEGVEYRADSWMRTADYMRTGEIPDGEMFVIEECRDADEAIEIGRWYRQIIADIRKQMSGQK